MRPFLLLLILFITFNHLSSQNKERPSLEVGTINGQIRIDGKLTEMDWSLAPFTNNLKTIVPVENGEPSNRTEVRVIANTKSIVFGIRCEDDNPKGIVRFAKLRDIDLDEEDHIRLVIDLFLDGQSGYIFAVNANGARYDALVSNRGESENTNWDAVWEANATVDSTGWSLEIRIPIQSINFRKGLTSWGFNIERRIQRNLETIRWTNIRRDQWLIQTSRAGLLTNIPEFDYGIGINVRPSLAVAVNQDGKDNPPTLSVRPSLDANQRIGPNILATVTANTDFAETDVDTRQTNLTRFPLFFPERRSFFLEGSDIFEFGFGTGSRTVLPFFSRRIGLYKGNAVPINAGLKLNGRVGKTAFGGLALRTGRLETPEDTLEATNMSVIRVRRNVFRESSFGIIASAGDPQSRDKSWMVGTDFTYQTTRFQGDKNFIAGGWIMQTGREDLAGDRTSLGFKIDYPNDRWDIALIYARIGEGFDPSLGFVPRKNVQYIRGGLTFAPRPENKWIRQMFNQLFMTYVTGINSPWQSYGIFTAPINWRLESGDRIEANYYPQGENLTEPFRIADNVSIPAGEYHFHRYRLETEFAARRRLNGQLTWWFGSFYEGKLDELEAEINWNPSQLINFEFSAIHNNGRLPWGDFTQNLVGFKVRFNVTPDLQLNSFVQYDTESRNMGWNARMHWIFSPLGEVFLVFNHNNLRQPGDRWIRQNQQVILKVRYNFRK